MRILANLNVVGTLDIDTVANAGADTDRFLVQDANGVVKYRTGAEVASDIGAAVGYVSTVKHEVKLGEAISKGQAVYVSGSDGTNMIVSKASNASEATSSKTFGLLESGGALNAKVFVITEGLLAGLDTSTATIGDPVWLGTAGNLIYGLVNKPYAPDHLVFIGIVTRVNQNNGEIFIKVQNGFELQELHNVQITSTPANNTVLSYETATSLYKMKSISTLLGYTPADDAGVVHIAGTETITGAKTFSATTTTFAKAVFNSPADGATGEGIVVGKSIKLDAAGVGEKAKIYVVSKDLSDTYGSGLQIQFANQADDKGFGFNLNTSGGFELYTKSTAPAWVKAITVSAAQLVTLHSDVKLAAYTTNGFVKTINSDGTLSIDAAAFTLTTNGSSGVATYNSGTGVLNIPNYLPSTGIRTVYNYTATASQTTFNATYAVGAIDVYYNGSRLNESEYTATNGTTVVLNIACVAGDLVDIVAYYSNLNAGVAYVPITRTITINGTTYDLSQNRSWTITADVSGSGTANQVAYWNGSNSITGSPFFTLNLSSVDPNAPVGDLIITGGPSYKNANILINRYTNAWESGIRLQTNGATDWYVGQSATGSNNNIEFYSYGTTSASLTLIKSSANANFGASVGVGTTSLTGYSLRVAKNITGDITGIGVGSNGTVQSDVTSSASAFNTEINTAAASFTLDSLVHYRAAQGTKGAGSTITNQYGFIAHGSMTGATNNYGFFGSLDSAANRWNLYMSGTAANYINGDTSIGTLTGGYKLNVGGTLNVTGAMTGSTTATFLGKVTGKGLRSSGVKVGYVAQNASGWFRVARLFISPQTGEPHGGIITISFGSPAIANPVTYVTKYFWSTTGVATLKLEKYGTEDYITAARIINPTSSTAYYLEFNFNSTSAVAGHVFGIFHDETLGNFSDLIEIYEALPTGTASGTTVATLPFLDHGTTVHSLNVVTSASFSSSLTANSFVKDGGLTSQFLKADGTVDGTTYQTALTNPVTGTGTAQYLAKFTATGSAIGDSSMYYTEGANSNSYTFGSVGAGAIYGISQFNVYSNNVSEMFFQWGSNKYLYIGNASGNISISAINTGTHGYGNLIYYNGSSATDRYLALGTESTNRIIIKQTGQVLIGGSSTLSTTYSSAKLQVINTDNSYVEIRSTSGQSSLVLTKAVQAAAYKPDVEFFNSGNFGIVMYHPTIVSSNYLMYYAADSGSNRSLSFQTEGSDRLTLNQTGTVRLNNYTTNGFVKFSGGDGTLSVDTNTYVPTSRTITINGVAQDLSANRSWSVGTVIGNSNVLSDANAANVTINGGYFTGFNPTNIPAGQASGDWGLMTFPIWTGNSTNERYAIQLAANLDDNSNIFIRKFKFLNTASLTAWYNILNSSNYSSYALPLSGGTMTGDIQMGNNQNRIIKFRTASAWDYSLRGVNDDFFITDNPGLNFIGLYYNGGGNSRYTSIMGSMNIYANGAVNIGGATTISGQLTTQVSDTGVGTKTIVSTFERTGAAPSGSQREVGIVFKDGNNPTIVGGITGVRYNSSGNFIGGLRFYVNANISTPATTFSNLTQALEFNHVGEATFANTIYGTGANFSSLVTIRPATNTTSSSLEFTNSDNAVISSYYSMTFAIDNNNAVGGRSFVFARGAKGYGNQVYNILAMNGDTGHVTPGNNGTQNLGSSSLRWATVFTSDLDMSNGIGDYTIVEGYEDLFLYNNNTGKVFKFNLTEVDKSVAPPKKLHNGE